MKRTKKKKLSALLMAILLTASIVLGSLWNSETAYAATGDYYIKVNKGTNVVTIYKQDGTPYTAFTCSTGYATPVGTFYTPQKYRWWTLDGPSYGQYCTRITRGFLFHSVWYHAQTYNSQDYVQYNKLGTTASHGCVRLTVAAAKWIYDNCPVGTKVIIFNGSAKDDPLGKPETIKVKVTGRGSRGWDPTDPNPDNPYKTKSTTPVITVSNTTIEYGASFGNGNMSCKDSGGFDITSWVKRSGTVNTKKAGYYPVTYSVIDSFGRTATKQVTYKVADIKPPTITGVSEKLMKTSGMTYNMLSGISAKNEMGQNLTNQIEVYIKAPQSKDYVRCQSRQYTFSKTGYYYVRYIVKNPNNGLTTTKEQTVIFDNKPATITGVKENLTKAYGSTYNAFAGIKAKNELGMDLTSQIEVYIKTPKGEGYKKCTSSAYKFTKLGNYHVRYVVKNPNNGMTTKIIQTVTVTDQSKPTLTSKTDWDQIVVNSEYPSITWDELNIGIKASLAAGKDMSDEVKVIITAPSGETETVEFGSRYEFKEYGKYKLVYIATNPNAPKKSQTTTHTRKAIYKMQAEVVLDE